MALLVIAALALIELTELAPKGSALRRGMRDWHARSASSCSRSCGSASRGAFANRRAGHRSAAGRLAAPRRARGRMDVLRADDRAAAPRHRHDAGGRQDGGAARIRASVVRGRRQVVRAPARGRARVAGQRDDGADRRCTSRRRCGTRSCCATTRSRACADAVPAAIRRCPRCRRAPRQSRSRSTTAGGLPRARWRSSTGASGYAGGVGLPQAVAHEPRRQVRLCFDRTIGAVIPFFLPEDGRLNFRFTQPGARPCNGARCTVAGGPMSTRLDYSKLSLMDALDLATLIEVEAQKRYTQFAERLGSRDSDDAGAVFASMAVNESQARRAARRAPARAVRRGTAEGQARRHLRRGGPRFRRAQHGTCPRWRRTRWRCPPKRRPSRSTTRPSAT